MTAATNTGGLPSLLIWGASGHARVIADIVQLQGRFSIYGFLDDVSPERHQMTFCGKPIFGGRDWLARLRNQGIEYVLIGIGDCDARLQLAAYAREKGYRLAQAIHPHATIAHDVEIGAGSVVMAGAVINSGTRIGENVIVNTSCSVDHDCFLADGVHISPGAHLGGSVAVGKGTWIGIGAVVKDKITVGSYSVLGAGAVLIRDLPDHVIAYGVPAVVQSKLG